MFRILATSIIGFLSMINPVFSHPVEVDFANFVATHNKQYSSSDEYYTRLNIFENNVKFIKSHNAANHSYTFGINQFTDLTNEEFKARFIPMKIQDSCWSYGQDRNACLQNNKCQYCNLGGMYGDFCAPKGSHNCLASSLEKNIRLNITSLPTALDWRVASQNPKNLVAVTAVKNQEQCGSCWSFSASGATEGAWAISGKGLVSLSEQELVDCSSSYGNAGCNGGDMDAAFQYIHDHGLCTEASYPYKAADGTCKKCTAIAHLNGYTDIPDEAGILPEIQKGPVSIAIEADQAVFQFYNGGVLDDSSCGTTLDHGVLIVGYGVDSTTGKDYWIIKNSWGASWGENGYIRIVRNKGMCGIGQMQSRPYYTNQVDPRSTLDFNWDLLWQCVGECGGDILKDIITCAGDLTHIWDILNCVGKIVGTVSPCYKCIKGILG